MGKLKTRRCVAKRLRFTKSGKIKRRKSGKGHILTKKTRKRKRLLRKSGLVSPAMESMVNKVMPYGK